MYFIFFFTIFIKLLNLEGDICGGGVSCAEESHYSFRAAKALICGGKL